MKQGVRDQVRLRLPRALALYQRHIAPLLGGDRRAQELADWATRGAPLVASTGMHGIRFEADGIWIDDGAGGLWAYLPQTISTTMGAEFGLRYEQAEVQVLADRLPAGGTLVDVGANVGLHSVQLAKLVDGLRVLAFEPVGQTFTLLQRNIAKNGVAEQVTARRAAVSDRDGTLRLTTNFQYANFVVPEGSRAAEDAVEEVDCRTLDGLLDGTTERVDAIKCDVEGAELAVLRGAEKTIDRFRPLLLLEVDARWAARYGNTGADVFAFLTGRGYGYECFVGEQLLPASTVEQDLGRAANFLFTPA